MHKNKLVLENCPNFYRIVNFDYVEDDKITSKLIKIYENFIFDIDITDEEDIEAVKKIDFVFGKYIDDYMFRRRMQSEIHTIKVKRSRTNVLRAIVESIISIFERYEEETTRNIYLARWI